MKLYQKILIALLIGTLLTLVSLFYVSSYDWCFKSACQPYPAWGFPFAYILDSDIGRLNTIDKADGINFLALIGNVAIYSLLSLLPFLLFKKKIKN